MSDAGLEQAEVELLCRGLAALGAGVRRLWLDADPNETAVQEAARELCALLLAPTRGQTAP
jgi:hypothetical protein